MDAAQMAIVMEATIAHAVEQFCARPSHIRWVDVRTHRERMAAAIDAARTHGAEQLTQAAGRRRRR